MEGGQQRIEGVAIIGERRYYKGVARTGHQACLAVGAQCQQIAYGIFSPLQARRL